MKLFVETELPVDPATCWDVFESAAFRERLEERANIKISVLEERTDGDVQYRKLRTEPERELPSFVAKLVGGSKLSYVQENRLNTSTWAMDWKVVLDVMSDRVDVSGRTSVVDLGNGSCRRTIDGEINVRVRLVGSQIEKAVVEQFEKSMERAIAIARELIAERASA